VAHGRAAVAPAFAEHGDHPAIPLSTLKDGSWPAKVACFARDDAHHVVLADVAIRVLCSALGAFIVMVDANDEKGVGLDVRHGFIRLDKTLSLFLPLDTLRAAGEKPR
jgi:hypothetical protein